MLSRSTLVAILAAVTVTVLNPVHAEGQPQPRGVVLVLIDDIGYGDIDILYPSGLETPNIDRLSTQSVRLTDFHVGTTCAPSRASLIDRALGQCGRRLAHHCRSRAAARGRADDGGGVPGQRLEDRHLRQVASW